MKPRSQRHTCQLLQLISCRLDSGTKTESSVCCWGCAGRAGAAVAMGCEYPLCVPKLVLAATVASLVPGVWHPSGTSVGPPPLDSASAIRDGNCQELFFLLLCAPATHLPLKNSAKNTCVYFFRREGERDTQLETVGFFCCLFSPDALPPKILSIWPENSHPLCPRSSLGGGPPVKF